LKDKTILRFARDEKVRNRGYQSHSRLRPLKLEVRNPRTRRKRLAMIMELPADIEYVEDANLFVWRPRGILDEAVVNKVLVDLLRREAMAAKPFNCFSDLSLVESFHLTFQYVFHVALHRRLSYAGRKPIKSAFYVTHPEAARLVKIHALMTDFSPLKVEMFEEREAAAKWLGVPVESLILQD
jgi:hypothetical protein